MANYKVGDEVVCIDASNILNPQCTLERGKIYKVADIFICDGLQQVALENVANSSARQCGNCFKTHLGGFYTWRFIKLDGLTEDQTTENEVTA